MSRIHLEYDVEVNDKWIKIIGIRHSNSNRPLGRKIQQIIAQQAQAHPEHTIYAERNSNHFLPSHLVEKALPLESEAEIQEHKKIIRGLKWKLEEAPEQEEPEIVIKGVHPKLANEMLQEFRKDGEEVELGFKYLCTFRSAQMANAIINAPHNHIIAVVGAGHALQLKKFLESEKLRERYLKLWRNVERRTIYRSDKDGTGAEATSLARRKKLQPFTEV